MKSLRLSEQRDGSFVVKGRYAGEAVTFRSREELEAWAEGDSK
jgi:hypothetical protein